jgi:hypothetical protein
VRNALIVGVALLVGGGLAWFFIYASGAASYAGEGDGDDDLVVANGLPPARASGRARDGQPAGPAPPLSTVPPAQPRDPAIGQDAYRAEARAQIHRWQNNGPVTTRWDGDGL